MRRTCFTLVLSALAVTAFSALAAPPSASTGRDSAEPVPLRGEPLRGKTGLRLVVADEPPFLLDVDANRVTRLRGVPKPRGGVTWVVGVAGRGAAVVADFGRELHVYGIAGPGARARSLGKARNVWPADGRAVWLERSVGRSRCSLRRAGLDGRLLRAPRAFPCASRSDVAGPLGLVVRRMLVLDPRTGRTVFRAPWGVLAVVQRYLVLAGPGRQFTLVDPSSGFEKAFSWPSILASMDEPAVDPRGRYVALAFADPAWQGGGEQALDVWVLDTSTSELTQVPGMPAFVGLKRTSMAWTDDGRLVLLAESGRKVVAVWRPGQERLAVKTVRLPERAGGSDSFALLR
jgi:hypothetical protein